MTGQKVLYLPAATCGDPFCPGWFTEGGADTICCCKACGIFEDHEAADVHAAPLIIRERGNANRAYAKDRRRRQKDAFRRYIRNRGRTCPFCSGQNLEGGSVDIQGSSATQRVWCSFCHEEWIATYTLADISFLNWR